MARWATALFAALIGFGAASAHAQSCTTTINPGQSLTLAVENAAAGSILCLNPGTYNPIDAGGWASGNLAHGISKNNLTIRGLGATPAQTIIAGGAAGDYAVKFVRYLFNPKPDGTTIQNVTIQGSQGGVQVWDYLTTDSRITGVTLRDVVINTVAGGAGHGVLARYSDQVVLDNVTITSNQTAINFTDVNDGLIMNSRVTQTGAAGLQVVGGSGNVIVGNTIGNPKSGSTYSFPTAGVVFYNTKRNRFENNVVQGQQFDGVDFHALDGAPFGLTGSAASQATQNSTDNYAGKNRVISTGFADGLPGGSGMWANCSSHNTWFYGNDVQGTPECGICVWTSLRNMLLGNRLYNHGINGIFSSGGNETTADCSIPAYRVTPSSVFIHSNNVYFNKNDQVTVRNGLNHELSRNYLAPSNGYGGPLQVCLQADTCQAAFSFDTDNLVLTAGNHRIVANTSHDNKRGFWTHPDTKTTGLQLSLNRILNERFSRYIVSGPTNIDAGPNIGGSFWTEHDAAGNPSNGSTPFSGIIDNNGSPTVGRVVDRYPYETEDLGRGYGVTVFEPRSGASLAQGTRRTVRWNAPGCTMVDLLLDGATSLLPNWGNSGYAVVEIPVATSVGSHSIVVQCKDSNGVVRGQGTSPTFSVTSSALQLLAPGRDDVFNANTPIWVAWKKTSAVGAVSVELSTDGGATFPTTLVASSTSTSARVMLPNIAANAYAVIRVRSGANQDHTDGVFAIRGTGAGFTSSNFPAGRVFVMGALERLEWASPLNSRVVTITASVNGGGAVPIATDLPDRGFYDWVVPDLGVGNLQLTLSFQQSDGSTVIQTVGSVAGLTRRAGTITISPLSSLVPGGSQPVSATSNSGLPVTLSSLTPGVCTLASGTVNAIANGTCTIAGSTAGNATFAPSGQVTSSFAVASDPPRLGNISTRMQVLTGNDVMIGGFIIGGSGNKTVVVRARGPSLIPFGIANALANPQLQLVRSSDQATIGFNNDWQSASNAAAITASGFAPGNSLEAAILMSLPPGAYTAVVSGVGGGTGVGIVEVFEVDALASPLVNISTRGQVLTGNDVMIGGFVIQGNGPQTVVVRARGPSLIPFGITNALANPQLQLVRSSDQATLATNDNWGDAGNSGAISASGFAPGNVLESAILVTLPPGAYTAIVSGVGGGTGVGIIEVFRVQ